MQKLTSFQLSDDAKHHVKYPGVNSADNTLVAYERVANRLKKGYLYFLEKQILVELFGLTSCRSPLILH